MARTIVRVQDHEDEHSNFVIGFFLSEPHGIPKAATGYRLACDPALPPFSDLRDGAGVAEPVKAAGSALFQSLAHHPAVSQAIGTALTQGPGGSSPIYVFVESARADLLPWECLFDEDKGFLALDPRWPVARLRDPLAEVDAAKDFVLEPPLRILAVLSAAGATAGRRAEARLEWNALWEPLRANALSKDGVPVALSVYVGEDTLKEQLDRLIPPARLDLRVEYVSGGEKLVDAVRSEKPHVLHFFCHGASKPTPHLRIGTRADWLAEREGSVALTGDELWQAVDRTDPVWLVMLNCCESAAQSQDARNLAGGLVVSGFPAAVGMREAFESDNAHLVTEGFYKAMLANLSKIPVGGPPVAIEWPEVLHEPRWALARKHANGMITSLAAREGKHWTIPVIYARPQPFRLRRQAAATRPQLTEAERAHLTAEAETLRTQYEAVKALPLEEAVKKNILRELRARLDEVEGRLRG
jgi:hypothetical protein